MNKPLLHRVLAGAFEVRTASTRTTGASKLKCHHDVTNFFTSSTFRSGHSQSRARTFFTQSRVHGGSFSPAFQAGSGPTGLRGVIGLRQFLWSPSAATSSSKRFVSTSPLLRAGRPNWYQGRPVQAIRAGPIQKLQNAIDRRLPKTWLLYGIMAINGAVFAAWAYAENSARR